MLLGVEATDVTSFRDLSSYFYMARYAYTHYLAAPIEAGQCVTNGGQKCFYGISLFMPVGARKS
jgi:hypothetical protein